MSRDSLLVVAVLRTQEKEVGEPVQTNGTSLLSLQWLMSLHCCLHWQMCESVSDELPRFMMVMCGGVSLVLIYYSAFVVSALLPLFVRGVTSKKTSKQTKTQTNKNLNKHDKNKPQTNQNPQQTKTKQNRKSCKPHH